MSVDSEEDEDLYDERLLHKPNDQEALRYMKEYFHIISNSLRMWKYSKKVEIAYNLFSTDFRSVVAKVNPDVFEDIIGEYLTDEMFTQIFGSTHIGDKLIIFQQRVYGATLESFNSFPDFTYQEFYELFVYLVERYIAFPNYNHRNLSLRNVILFDTENESHRYQPKLRNFVD